MSITIGRCSLSEDPYNLRVSGRQVSFDIDLVPTDVYEMKARRQQLIGLVNNDDEPVVPFTWSEDSSFDGHYRVTSVTVPSSEAMLTTGFVPQCSIQMEQVTGYANPWFEVVTSSVVLTNGHGVTTPKGLLGVTFPYVAAAVDTSSLPVLTTYTRNTEDGGSSFPLTAMTATAPVTLRSYRFSSPASYFYSGAARVEVLTNGTWRTVIGRQLPAAYDRWRISNGIVRLTSASAAGATGHLEVWNQAASGGVGAWQSTDVAHYLYFSIPLQIGFPGTYGLPPITIVRNSPERVTISVLSGAGAFSYYALDRGAMTVRHIGSGVRLGIGYNSSDPDYATTLSSLVAGSVTAASADAHGNALVMGCSAAFAGPGSGKIYPNSGTGTFVNWWGIDVGALGATPATYLRDEVLGATSLSQRIVTR